MTTARPAHRSADWFRGVLNFGPQVDEQVRRVIILVGHAVPSTSAPLYNHIVQRLYSSSERPYGPFELHALNEIRIWPNHETDASRIGMGFIPHRRAWVM